MIKRPILIVKPKPDVSYRIVSPGRHISAIRTVKDRWGGRRLAIVEHDPYDPPTRIDPRSPKIKHVLMVWKWSVNTKAGWNVARRLENYVYRRELVERLNQLWPLHWAAKELSHPVLHLKLPYGHKPSEYRWLVNIINKLMPRSQDWLVKRGYIQRGEDNRFSLTEAGHDYFIKKRPKPAADARHGVRRRRRPSLPK